MEQPRTPTLLILYFLIRLFNNILNSEYSGYAEICDFDDFLFLRIECNVLKFQIRMYDIVAMALRQHIQQLVHDTRGLSLRY